MLEWEKKGTTSIARTLSKGENNEDKKVLFLNLTNKHFSILFLTKQLQSRLLRGWKYTKMLNLKFSKFSSFLIKIHVANTQIQQRRIYSQSNTKVKKFFILVRFWSKLIAKTSEQHTWSCYVFIIDFEQVYTHAVFNFKKILVSKVLIKEVFVLKYASLSPKILQI